MKCIMLLICLLLVSPLQSFAGETLLPFALSRGAVVGEVPGAAQAAHPDPAFNASAEDIPPGRDDRIDKIIVKFKDLSLARAKSMGSEHAKALSARAGMALSHFRPMSGDSQVFKLPRRMKPGEAQAIADLLSQDPGVEYAVPDRIMFPLMVPNDPSYASQWDFQSPATETAGINLPAAWDITTGASDIVVGVVDTGIVNHSDLQGRVLPGYNFISNAYVAGNGIGRSADASDLGDWEGTSPSSWHGTHVSGTIAATSNNGVGVTGINWNSKILPVRVMGHGGGEWSDIADGMRWAAGLPVPGAPANPNPARVLNLSLGGSGACSVDEQTTIDAITAAGVVVVIAAGNSAAEVANFSPASCRGVITVASVGRTGAKSYFTNYGEGIEISAPGESILSTLNTGTTSPVASPSGDKFGMYSGTSMATPHVVGVVSLMLSVNPDLTPGQVLAAIQSSARPFPANSGCTTSKCGAGILDAFQALTSITTNVPIAGTSPSALSFTKVQGDQNVTSQSLSIEIVNGATANWSVQSDVSWAHLTPAAGQGSGVTTVTIDPAGLLPGKHSGTITLTVDGAINSPLTVPVSLHLKTMLALKAPMPVAGSYAAMATVGQKVYVIGGSPTWNAVQIYDTTTNTWSTGASKPTGVYRVNAAVIDGKVYVPGGRIGSSNFKNLEVYDPATNQWSSRAPMPVALAASGVEAVNGKLYVLGGFDSTGKSFADVYVYDPATDSWDTRAPIAGYYGRSSFGSGVIDGKIYVFGGWDTTGDASGRAQVYDPATNVWSYIKDMNQGRLRFTGGVLAGKLYAIGGVYSQYSDGHLSDADVYDPVADIWSEASFLMNQGRSDLKAVTVGDALFVAGGTYYDGQTRTSNVLESYTFPSPPVYGACGSSDGAVLSIAPTTNFCSSGTANPVTGTGPWSWTCSGSFAGTTASCITYPTFPAITNSLLLPDALRGNSYAVNLTAAYGVSPYTWSVASGNLPVGLTLNPSTGLLSGIPQVYLLSPINLQVTDSVGASSTRTLHLFVKIPRARIVRDTQHFDYVHDAYPYCADGDVIKVTANVLFNEDLFLTRPIGITLQGGYNDTFTTSSGLTGFNGVLKVSSGKVKLDGIAFR